MGVLASWRASAAAMASVVLTACGGGGGDSDASPGVSGSFPLSAAYTRAMTQGITLSGTARSGADTFHLALDVRPATDEVFEGTIRKKALVTLALRANGALVANDVVQAYFSVDPYTSRGERYGDGSVVVSATGSGVLPVSAQVGTGGSLGTSTMYTDAARTTVEATMQSTWTLEPGDGNSAYACTHTTIRYAGTVGSADTESLCYRLDTNGNVLGLRYTVSVDGVTLVFQ